MSGATRRAAGGAHACSRCQRRRRRGSRAVNMHALLYLVAEDGILIPHINVGRIDGPADALLGGPAHAPAPHVLPVGLKVLPLAVHQEAQAAAQWQYTHGSTGHIHGGIGRLSACPPPDTALLPACWGSWGCFTSLQSAPPPLLLTPPAQGARQAAFLYQPQPSARHGRPSSPHDSSPARPGTAPASDGPLLATMLSLSFASFCRLCTTFRFSPLTTSRWTLCLFWRGGWRGGRTAMIEHG